MIKKATFFIFILFSTACSKTDAIKTGDKFYGYIKTHQYERIEPLIDYEALDSLDFNIWTGVLKKIEQQRGEFIKAEPVKITKQFDNDKNKITLIEYKARYAKAKYIEQITFIKRKNSDSTKIYQYNFSVKKLEK